MKQSFQILAGNRIPKLYAGKFQIAKFSWAARS